MLWLLVLKLIQAVLDAPNCAPASDNSLSCSVVEIRGAGKAPVHPHIHAKLKAVSSDVHLSSSSSLYTLIWASDRVEHIANPNQEDAAVSESCDILRKHFMLEGRYDF